MISKTERDLFVLMIDISDTIWKNDCAAVPSLIEDVNSRELTATDSSRIADAMSVDRTLDIKLTGDGDAYTMMVNGFNCITNKAYLLKMRNLSLAIDQRNKTQLRISIDEALAADCIIDPVESDNIYISFLIRACMLLKDYSSMELLRDKLGEVSCPVV